MGEGVGAGVTGGSNGGRNMLQKHQPSVGAEESFMGRKRFSKRQSKSGLAAVF